jgi:alginate O-acetyltransferase complex protein AlgI
MLFNSINFAFFLPVVFALYWLLRNQRLVFQNGLLLLASYFFYSCWDYRFLFLLLFSTLLDFYSALKIDNAQNVNHKKIWFWLSIIINLGLLAVLKYYNFFVSSFSEALSLLGMQANIDTLNIILPVGISFYTFHGLSYIIDVYKGRIPSEKRFIDYAVFVSFFPLLVAGPIERATHLLPQIKSKRFFDYGNAVSGLRQILWGLFKKIVIADSCAEYANLIFNNPEDYSGSSHVMGAVFFTFQIYGDFSGYSDIALGTARLFGIELLRNFNYPYFSRDIAEFWRRWHISLSSWFKDYLYIPLGGSSGGTWMKVRNTFIIFLVSGFWHGANWTFIFWGLLNALFIMPSIIFKTNRDNLDVVAQGKLLPTVKELYSICLTFLLTVFAWIFFRSKDISSAFSFISEIFSSSLFSIPQILPFDIILLIVLFMIIEWINREEKFSLSNFGFTWPRFVRWSFYVILAFCIFIYSGKDEKFIYFQF